VRMESGRRESMISHTTGATRVREKEENDENE
jgi:hypothetical protein